MTQQPLTLMPETELATIVPDDDAGFGSLSTSRGQLPLEAMDVRGRVVGLVAELELRQTFVNTLDEPIEATYIFPLPDRAAVTSFRMEVNGRIVDGVIKERGEARRDYDQAIQAGHRAAITEEERSGVFTMRVGNLLPREQAVVRLTMTGPLPLEDNEVTFRFPLVVAPRYIPGTELSGPSVGDGTASDTDAVPDASRITPPVLLPGYPNPVRLSLRIDVDPGGLSLSKLRSSLHAVADTRGAGGARRIELRPGERLNRDFILRYSVAVDSVQSSLVLAKDAQGDEGTFMLTLVPPVQAPGQSKPRDVMFVLDRSGSMGGWKMVAARRAVARMVDTLGNADKFNVIAFDDRIETPASFQEGKLVAATDRNRFRAVEFLATLNDRGGTEMARPLQLAVDALVGGYADRERILVLVTDGQVGNEDQILRTLRKRLKNVRIFTLGIDRAVNAGFLRRLATLGAGAFELVESEDRLDEVMDKIHRRIAIPVVTELSLVPQGMDVVADSIVPERIPDLFANTPVTITGRYRGQPGDGIRVAGADLLGGAWTQAVPPRAGDDSAVTRLWARGLIRQLEDHYVAGGHGGLGQGELERRIIAVSLAHSVLSRFTAFVAIDRESRIETDGAPHRIVQPVDTPDGWAMGAAAPMIGMPAAAPAMADGLIMRAGMPAVAAAPMSPQMSKRRGAVGAIAAGVATGVGAVLGAPFAAAKALADRVGGSGGRAAAKSSADEEVLAGDDEGLDLSSYLDRVRELASAMRSALGTADERPRLTQSAAQLRQLVEDLESLCATLAPKPEISSLRNLYQRLAQALKVSTLDREDVERVCQELDELAGGTPASTSRGAFWK